MLFCGTKQVCAMSLINKHGAGSEGVYKASRSTAILLPGSFPIVSSLLLLLSVPMTDHPMSTSFWNPLEVSETGASSRGESKYCCGITRSGASCKNLIKREDLKQGHQKLAQLGSFPFELSSLQSALCDIAKYFLCTRWHRDRQADRLGQQWYEAAVQNQAQADHGPESSPQSQQSRSRQRQRSTDSQLAESDNTQRPTSDGETVFSPHSTTTPSRSMGSYVTAATLRANSVPWRVSPTQPAILSCITNIRAGLQGIHLHSISRSEEVSDIHCMFCLGDDEDHAHESVVLRCTECRALSHLACIEEWLAKRDAGFNISCCVW